MNVNVGRPLPLTVGRRLPSIYNTRKPFRPAKQVDKQVTHSMPREKLEIFKSLQGWADTHLLVNLKPVEKSWQPQEFLPDPASPGFYQEVEELRQRSSHLSDDYFVVLVGDMITEEAVPTYMSILNTLDGIQDETCCSKSPWAIWTRAWTAEENRHGDLLNKYLYLSGRVDMFAIEKTIQYLIGTGMDFKWENNPYMGFVYTSFQERATFISHGNTARLAKEQGDLMLAQICGTIAADEKRHETAYVKIVEKLFEVDPDTTMLAFADMMKKRVQMPAKLIYDGEDHDLFRHFSAVAQRMGVYTARDYAEIVDYLVERWKVDQIRAGLSGEGRRAQDYVCGLGARFLKLHDRAQHLPHKTNPTFAPFTWIFGTQVRI